ncbi:MAG: glycosyltransferase family 39 protein [Candidatus Omnitrophota bacterium]
MNPNGEDQRKPPRFTLYKLWFYVLAYIALNAFSQFLTSPTAELDQSEQLVLSQSLQLGYASHPPLYTWIAFGVFIFTGPSLLALLVVKILILSSLMGLLIAVGREFEFSERQHLIAIIGVIFIPQFIWESQRDLTHSSLATMFAAAALLQTARLSRNPSVRNYALLGLIAGFGVLSKYNFLIYCLGLLLAAAFTPQYRKAVFRLPLLLSIAITVAMAIPHAVWASSHIAAAASSLHKIESISGKPLLGIGKTFAAVLVFLTPFWLAAVFLAGRKILLPVAQAGYRLFLSRLFLVMLGVILLFVLLSGAQKIKDRWFQPLLFFTPLLLALYSAPSPKRLRQFYGIGIVCALLISVALPMRTILAGYTERTNRLNIPFKASAAKLSQSIGSPAVIFAENRLLGGNMRLAFPSAAVITPDEPAPARIPSGKWVILCETINGQNQEFREWLKKQAHIDLKDLSFDSITQTYYYSQDRKYSLYWSAMNQP